MKKIISIVLACAMALSLVACGSSDDGSGVQMPKLSDKIQRSTYDETTNTYYNDFTGLRLTLPESWRRVDDDIISSLYYTDLEAGQLAEKDHEYFVTQHTITDMMCMAQSTTDRFVVIIQNLAAMGDEAYADEAEYVSEIKKRFTDDGVTVEEGEDISLSGYTFKTIVAKSSSSDAYYAYQWRGDGYIVVVLFSGTGNYSREYVWSMFNGGPETADIANVPSLHTYNSDYNRLVNQSTGVSVDLPATWNYYSYSDLAGYYYGTTEDELLAFTAEELAARREIWDMLAYSAAGDRVVEVKYVNRKTSTEMYGMDMDRIHDYYMGFFENKDGYFVYESPDATICDIRFQVVSVSCYSGDSNSNICYAFAPLNDDYLIQISYITNEYASFEDILYIFNENNDVEQLPGASVYDESTRHLYNENTKLGYTVPKGWEVCEKQILLDYLYTDVTVEEFDRYTEDQLKAQVYLPDFAVFNQDTKELVMAYYINGTNLYSEFSGHMDYTELCDLLVERYEDSGMTVVERDYGYCFTDKEFMNATFKYTTGDRTYNYYLAVAQADENYFLVLEVMGNPDSTDIDYLRNLDGNSAEFNRWLQEQINRQEE